MPGVMTSRALGVKGRPSRNLVVVLPALIKLVTAATDSAAGEVPDMSTGLMHACLLAAAAANLGTSGGLSALNKHCWAGT